MEIEEIQKKVLEFEKKWAENKKFDIKLSEELNRKIKRKRLCKIVYK